MIKIKNYMPFATNSFQAKLAYKGDTVMFLFGQSMLMIVTAFLWRAIYSSSNDAILNGFNLSEMIVYMIIAFLTNVVISNRCINTIYTEIKDGSVAMSLIKPISYTSRLFFETLGQVIFNSIIVFVPMLIIVTIYLTSIRGTFNILDIILYIVSTILSIILNFFYYYCFGLLAFKITNMWGTTQIMNAITKLLSGTLIPIVFFPSVVAKIFNILPFSSITSTPTLLYLGQLQGMEIVKALLLQIVWIFLFYLLSRFIWKKLISQITILGG